MMVRQSIHREPALFTHLLPPFLGISWKVGHDLTAAQNRSRSKHPNCAYVRSPHGNLSASMASCCCGGGHSQ